MLAVAAQPDLMKTIGHRRHPICELLLLDIPSLLCTDFETGS